MMDMRTWRKERASVRAQALRIRLIEGFANAREGRILYNKERAEELFEILEALAPILREFKSDFDEEKDYAMVNMILGMILRGRGSGDMPDRKHDLFERKLRMLLSQWLEFHEMFGALVSFLELRNADVVDAEFLPAP